MPSRQQALADLAALFNAGRAQMGIPQISEEELMYRLGERHRQNQMRTDQPSGAPDAARPYMPMEDQRNDPVRAPMRAEIPSRPYAPPMQAAETPSGPPSPQNLTTRMRQLLGAGMTRQQAVARLVEEGQLPSQSAAIAYGGGK